MSEAEISRAVELRHAGHNWREIGAALHYSRGYLLNVCIARHPNLRVGSGEHSSRPEQAAILRRQGLSWAHIAVLLGYRWSHNANRAALLWQRKRQQERAL